MAEFLFCLSERNARRIGIGTNKHGLILDQIDLCALSEQVSETLTPNHSGLFFSSEDREKVPRKPVDPQNPRLLHFPLGSALLGSKEQIRLACNRPTQRPEKKGIS